MITQADIIPGFLSGRVMLFSPHQMGIEFLQSQIPFKDNYVDAFVDSNAAIEAMKTKKYSIVLVDYSSQHPDAREVLVHAKSQGLVPNVFVLSHSPNISITHDVYKLGDDHIFHHTGREQDALTQTLEMMFVESSPVRWVSRVRQKFHSMRHHIADKKNKNILAVGESGTAKLSLAQIAHCRSVRCSKPFIFANCKTGSDRINMLWDERDTKRFERNIQNMLRDCDGGTIYIHEVDHLDMEAQAILAEVLHKGIFTKIADNNPEKFKGVVICSVTKNPQTMVKEKLLSKDLLKLFDDNILEIPSLREFPQDIAPMATEMLKCHCMLSRRPEMSFQKDAKEALANHTWKRNVRELFSLIKQTAQLSDLKHIGIKDLYFGPHIEPKSSQQSQIRELKASLRKHRGNKTAACEDLGISRKTLYNRMKKFNIPEDYN